MDIETKITCVNMRFDDGSYHEVVLPILKIWQDRLDEEICINQSIIRITEVEEGIEKNVKHVDTQLVVILGKPSHAHYL